MTNEKPSEVEVGQRFDCDGNEYTVTARTDDGRWKIRYDTGRSAGKDSPIRWLPEEILPDRFLGYAPGFGPPIGDRPVPAAGQRWRDTEFGDGITTLRQFKAAGDGRDWARWITDDGREIAVEFLGARFQFVDHGSPSLTPAPTAAPEPAVIENPKVGKWQVVTHPGYPWRDGKRDTIRSPEMQRAGVALSAIEAVPARKPPEPWRPSCDDDYWLADAGTSYRSGR